jgi:tetratricopeptide (TPR) repeat protein
LSRADLEDGFDDVTDIPALFSRRRLDLAVRVSPAAIPERALALTLRAESLIARSDRAGARQAVDEALELAPTLVSALVMGATLDEADGRRDAAIHAYRQIIELDPVNVMALNNLAYALAVPQKMPAEGLPFARRAVAAAPNNATVIDTLAWIQHLLGDHAGAAQLMTTVLRSNTLNPDIRLHAAIVFAAAGQRAQALNQLGIALKLNPALAGTPEVKQLQAQLK